MYKYICLILNWIPNYLEYGPCRAKIQLKWCDLVLLRKEVITKALKYYIQVKRYPPPYLKILDIIY